eukprot:COSAG04_NODE_17826_length_458_cov_0.568245_1_plen_78_part_01
MRQLSRDWYIAVWLTQSRLFHHIHHNSYGEPTDEVVLRWSRKEEEEKERGGKSESSNGGENERETENDNEGGAEGGGG